MTLLSLVCQRLYLLCLSLIFTLLQANIIQYRAQVATMWATLSGKRSGCWTRLFTRLLSMSRGGPGFLKILHFYRLFTGCTFTRVDLWLCKVQPNSIMAVSVSTTCGELKAWSGKFDIDLWSPGGQLTILMAQHRSSHLTLPTFLWQKHWVSQGILGYRISSQGDNQTALRSQQRWVMIHLGN